MPYVSLWFDMLTQNNLVKKSEGVYDILVEKFPPVPPSAQRGPDPIIIAPKLHQTASKPHKIRGGQSNIWLL